MIHSPAILYESELAHRWWSLAPGTQLPLYDGHHGQLLFCGRPGSSSGPDVHDAILLLPGKKRQATHLQQNASASLQQYVGDVEFHIHPRDWYLHQHHLDPRYNNVLLHVVWHADTAQTRRQDGVCIPLCTLNDIPIALSDHLISVPAWPCQRIIQDLDEQRCAYRLEQAGLLRFEQKTEYFVEQVHQFQMTEDEHAYDICLILALAEGLAYGRDRAFFRAAGLRLLQRVSPLPEPLGRSEQPSPLDVKRLRILARMHNAWYSDGAWCTLQRVLQSTMVQPPTEALDVLRQSFSQFGLGLARTDILICNVVLPFAAAIGLLENRPLLSERARMLYLHHPGLSSNRITRMMSAQLQLSHEPQGSCRQQGLHYIYQQTCREKRCDRCLFGRDSL
jgi:hypothetical protein